MQITFTELLMCQANLITFYYENLILKLKIGTKFHNLKFYNNLYIKLQLILIIVDLVRNKVEF